MKNLSYLYWAYNIVWGALFVFLVLLYGRQKKLKASLEKLRKEIS